jgi:predicted subunit of tRNA(5-methylaminomethyl-2-thiouridylate) methyltransferase
MKACVLYSGGKDSSLMAVILQKLGYQVELVTVNFGVFPSWKPAAQSAQNLGFPHQILAAPENLLQEAVEMIINDGFPNHGLNHIHSQALRIAADDYPAVADGTRRDDRVPKLNSNQIRSFEDSKNVEYLNLAGFGYKTIDKLSRKLFKVKKELTTASNNSDYEIEIRYFIDQLRGDSTASRIFPEHIQSRVTGWRENE